MRCSSLLEPCGSHHDEASWLKCETSVWLTEDVEEGSAVVEWCLGKVCGIPAVGRPVTAGCRSRNAAAERRLAGSASKEFRRMGAIANG